ncbi:RING/U-box superfamily protein isoform 1 [Hibiscus syriacus]|uniref:RING/U-box superfamily protein isoform 1 n=1 Tax=Hibiscus syriacus TaxID=106335 RepID=A0A6A2X0U8_HIBSY|nr:RING/U-box superfamily protein isoform 1 [Hibiscus syriacus]
MASAGQNPMKPMHKITLFLLLILTFSLHFGESNPDQEDPTPTPWPLQFHSILVMNYSGILQVIDLWYDWPNGRNFNIIQHQLGNVLHDLEWNNGTSFWYTLDSSRTCSSTQLEVGILRPNWLNEATYLGQRSVDGFLCNVWEKVDFITYFEDVVTKRPVHWVFYTGREAHVMTFEVGAVLEDSKWQAPVYCFDNTTKPPLIPPPTACWTAFSKVLLCYEFSCFHIYFTPAVVMN